MPKAGKHVGSINDARKKAREGGDVWVKGFKDPQTLIRWMEEADDFEVYMEHFKRNLGTNGSFFFCNGYHLEEGRPPYKNKDECEGCMDEDSKVQRTSLKFAGNALDVDGRLQVYKIGSQLHEKLSARQQRTGTITDRDMVVLRNGTGLETNYDIDVEDPSPLGEAPEKLHNIESLLHEAYRETFPDSPTLEMGNVAGGAAPKQKVAETKRATKTTVTDPPGEKSGPQERPDFGAMETDEIKSWLDDNGVEFAPRAPRAKLIILATAKAEDIPPY